MASLSAFSVFCQFSPAHPPPHHSISRPKHHLYIKMSLTSLQNTHPLTLSPDNLHPLLHHALRIRPPPIHLLRHINLLPHRRLLRPTTPRQHTNLSINLPALRPHRILHRATRTSLPRLRHKTRTTRASATSQIRRDTRIPCAYRLVYESRANDERIWGK